MQNTSTKSFHPITEGVHYKNNLREIAGAIRKEILPLWSLFATNMNRFFTTLRTKSQVTGLTDLQRQVVRHYMYGEFDHIRSVEEAKTVGDRLFLFLMNEARDAADQEEYLGMLGLAEQQVRSLMNEIGGTT
jgi:hypothetical protein